MRYRAILTPVVLFLLSLGVGGSAVADSAQIAVAANFLAPARQLAADFGRTSGHAIIIVGGASGKLYAQIANGAPFDALLSADAAIPEKLQAAGLAPAGARFTYAIGRLVLWSPQPGRVDARGEVLKTGRFRHLAMASPKLAPYGFAAQQTLSALGLRERLGDRIVFGENIGQTHQFVTSDNAELGFVALSQVTINGKPVAGSAWIVPAALHDPIRQDAVLLAHGRDNAAAVAFLAYLRGDAARRTIAAFGYALP